MKLSSRPQFQFRAVTPREPLATLKETIYDWFLKRGITREVVDRNRISRAMHYMPQTKKTEACIAFSYYVGDVLTNVKYRDQNKNFSQTPGADRTFYKLNDIALEDSCIITEGEIDALSFEVAGFPNAISVPDGAPNPEAKNVDTKLEFLENSRRFVNHIERFYLACDADGPGIRLRDELARRLGKHRSYIVHFPQGCKDANEVLTKHGPAALKECIETAELYPVEGAIQASSRLEYLDDMHEYGFPLGASTQVWHKFDEHFKFYPGQLTVVTGAPSHGKSNFIDALSVHLTESHKWKWGVFSPENYPIEIHEMRLAELFTGRALLPSYNSQMTRDELDSAKEFISSNYHYILPENENYTLDNILSVAEYYVASKGINGLIIDPWNTIEHQIRRDETETVYTGKTLNRIKFFARHFGIHVFVIAHPTKLERVGKQSEFTNYEVPSLYKISGSANWFNVPDNGTVVYRRFFDDGTSDVEVYIQKIKHQFIGKPGMVTFSFDESCKRYSEIQPSKFAKFGGL